MNARNEQPKQTAVALVQNTKALEAMIVSAAPRAAALGKVDVKRMYALAAIAAEKNPQLFTCSRDSIFWACLEATRVDLAFDGVEGALVPYWNKNRGVNEARFQPMVQGVIKVAVRSEAVRAIDAVAVYKGEPFKVVRGTSPRIDHEQIFDSSVARTADNVVAAYVIFTLPDGSTKFETMGREEIEKIRSVSQTGRKGYGPWEDWFDQMAIKSVIKRGIKQLPKKPAKLVDLLDIDTRVEIGTEARSIADARAKQLPGDGEMPEAPPQVLDAGDDDDRAPTSTKASGVVDKLEEAAAKAKGAKAAHRVEREPGSDDA